MNQSFYRSIAIKSSEITPETVFLSRRSFLKAMGVAGAGALLAACAPGSGDLPAGSEEASAPVVEGNYSDELGDPANSYEQITNYNNYYEFTTDKERVAGLARNFKTSPWTVEVTGYVNKPQTFGIEDLLTRYTQEERVYRLRCVEGWSMVIPWQGFSLGALLKEVEPTSQAKYVAFTAILDEEQMPGQRGGFFPWPYTEGLRLDEAMNDLTILSTGLYGKTLLPQNGAPLRLVVPWKYGFKSIKGIVKIELTEYRPDSLWSLVAPNEYGFFANVNPEVDHPRWSQASERRIGENRRRETLLFNGYAEQVASMYEGLDLRRNY
jgi:sulfoxide reductase catalytic subunit YedY